MSINPIYLEFSVVFLGIILLLLEAFRGGQNQAKLAWFAIIGLIFILLATLIFNTEVTNFSQFYTNDRVAIFYKQFILLTTILVLLMSLPYSSVLEQQVPGGKTSVNEFFILPLFACAGMMWLVSAQDFIFLFVALELTTICFYVLITYMRRNELCLEAGTKYFILGALSTGFLIYGISWIFGVTGQTNFEQISSSLATLSPSTYPPLLFGLALIFIALGFKIAAFPFQFWVPDVYQGAPTPITAYLSIASKAAGFVVLFRLIGIFLPIFPSKILGMLSITAGATVLFGNLVALLQKNVKRLLAYSSIAHAGFLLIGLASLSAPLTPVAIAFYLVAYLLMTLLAFFVIVLVSRATGGEEISDFQGLGKRSPLLAASMLIALLSLAGIPFTAGFFGKLFIFMTAVEARQWILVILGAIGVCCGFYYYFRIIEAMYWKTPSLEMGKIGITRGPATILILLCISIMAVGIDPHFLLAIIISVYK